jgi:hypothetical protein
VVGDSQHRCGLGPLQRLAVGQPDQGCRREVEEPAGTIFISAKPDPIWRRRSEPANKPGNKRKLPESRTPIERADERGREQRVRVGDVEDAVAAGAPGGCWRAPGSSSSGDYCCRLRRSICGRSRRSSNLTAAI